jgi:hypothetical protein
MNGFNVKVGFAGYVGAAMAALQWRLLLLWVIALLIPTIVVAFPLVSMLAAQLGHSVHADEFARRFSVPMVADLMTALAPARNLIGGVAMIATIITLLISPWLAGMAVASGRAARPLPFAQLIQGGVAEYGRMFRLALWSLVPYGAAFGAAMAASNAADDRADLAVLQSTADSAANLALLAALVVFVLAQMIVESARAQYIADLGLRSATRAMGRGLRQLLRRPLVTLLVYLLITVIGLAIVGVLGFVRIRVTPLGVGSMVLAFVLVQLGVMVTAWMRTARLFSLAMTARTLLGRRGENTRTRSI